MPRNQCDGCARGLPIVDGAHQNPANQWDRIGCTADRYAVACPRCGKSERSPQCRHPWHVIHGGAGKTAREYEGPNVRDPRRRKPLPMEVDLETPLG